MLVTGGSDTTGKAIASAEIFNLTSQSFTQTKVTMETSRTYHTATMLSDGTMLLAGGMDANRNELATAEVFDPVSGNFTGTGSMITAREAHTATMVNNGKVLVTGGANGTGQLALAELFQ